MKNVDNMDVKNRKMEQEVKLPDNFFEILKAAKEEQRLARQLFDEAKKDFDDCITGESIEKLRNAKLIFEKYEQSFEKLIEISKSLSELVDLWIKAADRDEKRMLTNGSHYTKQDFRKSQESMETFKSIMGY